MKRAISLLFLVMVGFTFEAKADEVMNMTETSCTCSSNDEWQMIDPFLEFEELVNSSGVCLELQPVDDLACSNADSVMELGRILEDRANVVSSLLRGVAVPVEKMSLGPIQLSNNRGIIFRFTPCQY